jgi:hypothetical protein
MPTRSQVCTWIAGFGLVVPSLAVAQDRTERDVVELIVRDGPQARAIRAESEVTRREQLARLAYPNPTVTYSRESAGFTEFLQAEQSVPLFGARAALSRAGVAATAAAEADRDVRLWALRSDAAVAAARLVAEQDRLEWARGQVRDDARSCRTATRANVCARSGLRDVLHGVWAGEPATVSRHTNSEPYSRNKSSSAPNKV